MAIPAGIRQLQVSEIDFQQFDRFQFTRNGTPWLREFGNKSLRRRIRIRGICDATDWTALVADYATNHSTTFVWTDDSVSPSVGRNVRYLGRPTRTFISPDGVDIGPSGEFFVEITLGQVT